MSPDQNRSDKDPEDQNKKPDLSPSDFTLSGIVCFGLDTLTSQPEPESRAWRVDKPVDAVEVDEDEDNFDEDDFDESEEPIVRDPALFSFAEKILPLQGEISQALDLVTNMSLEYLTTAGILEEHLRGQMSDMRVDRIVAAAILCGAANYNDIVDDFSLATSAVVDDYYTILETMTPKGPDMDFYKDISMDGQRLYIARIAADMEILDKRINSGDYYEIPERKDMHETAHFLCVASRHPAETPNRGDRDLMLRTVTAFNRVAEIMNLKIDLVLSSPNMTISLRDKTKPVDPKHLKPKFDRKAQKKKGDYPNDEPKNGGPQQGPDTGGPKKPG